MEGTAVSVELMRRRPVRAVVVAVGSLLLLKRGERCTHARV